MPSPFHPSMLRLVPRPANVVSEIEVAPVTKEVTVVVEVWAMIEAGAIKEANARPEVERVVSQPARKQ